MSDNIKSVGSGYFSAFVGLMSIIFSAFGYLTPHIAIDPKRVLAAWLLLSGIFMTIWGIIPRLYDHDRCAQSRRPMDMIFQG
jgi:hypothetical protein